MSFFIRKSFANSLIHSRRAAIIEDRRAANKRSLEAG